MNMDRNSRFLISLRRGLKKLRPAVFRGRSAASTSGGALSTIGKTALLAFIDDRRGAVAMIFVLFAVPMLAMTGLAVDIGHVLAIKAQVRTTADAAALAAVTSVGDSAEALSRAVMVAELNMPTATNGTVLADADVVVGTWDTDTQTFSDGGESTNAVKVTIRRTEATGNPIELFFAAIVNFSSIDVTISAVATGSAGGTACVLALHDSDSGAIAVSGTSDVDFNDCDLAANSTDDDALTVTTNARLDANCAWLVGDTDESSPQLDLTCGSAVTGTGETSDPYSGLTTPTAGSCDETNFNNTSGTVTISPGTYCGNFKITGGTVKLNAGTYIIDQGNFTVNGGATLEEASGGTGVTIILMDSSGGDSPGTVTINGGADVTLAAPTSGTYSGVVFFQDKASASGTNNKFNGGSTTNFTGALYFPNEDIEFTGGNTSGGSTCTQIIAQKIKFSGNSVLNSTCTGLGTQAITISSGGQLVQ